MREFYTIVEKVSLLKNIHRVSNQYSLCHCLYVSISGVGKLFDAKAASLGYDLSKGSIF